MRKTHNAQRTTHNPKPSFLYIALFVLSFAFNAYAEEITILYTGSTHAMLYSCNCPLEPDGGAARRATLVNQLRKENPNLLLLDSGSFFAGGLKDDYTQNTQLDTQRTAVNLKAMGLMRYDAVATGADEFNFGTDFLRENIDKAGFPFVSCNISLSTAPKMLKPYIIKEFPGLKIGIIGVTGSLVKQKAAGLKFIPPEGALNSSIKELKAAGVKLVILLSDLEEKENLSLVKSVKGVDIVISPSFKESLLNVPGTLMLKPSWQGRRLGKLSLNIDGGKVDYKLEEPRLSDKIRGDKDVLSILPQCFSDLNCSVDGSTGSCQNPGTSAARCEFAPPVELPLLIISPKACLSCNTAPAIAFLKKHFPGLVVSTTEYPGVAADKIIAPLGIETLPAYLFGREIERVNDFSRIKENFEQRGEFYILKPQTSGLSYFISRNREAGSLDLFLSLFGGNIPEILDSLKEFNPRVHFLAVEQPARGFDAAKGAVEVEEDLRSVCVGKYYPRSFWSYIRCRAAGINSSWWENCLEGLETKKIRACAQAEEGRKLLRENISLNKELGVMFGPTLLLENQEIFSLQGVPKKEELYKLIGKNKQPSKRGNL